MKIKILLMLLSCWIFSSCKKDEKIIDPIIPKCGFIDFRYYNGEKIYFSPMSNDYLLIAIDSIYSDAQIDNFISGLNEFDQSYNYKIYHNPQYRFKSIPLKFKSSKNCDEITQTIFNLEQNNMVSYVNYTMQTDNCLDLLGEPLGNLCVVSYSSNFYVKAYNIDNLTEIVAETNTEVVGQMQFMPAWFILRATKLSKGDACDMANYFYESGLFEEVDLGFGKYSVE